jgi:outer membrane protein OmpA-like peptidoglycan-associated protein
VPRPKLPVVFVRAACALALATIGGNALSLPGGRMVGRFDFGYAIRGDRAARPVQVFDDGAGKTYFEVRPGQPMPAVFAGKELEFLVAQPEGAFYTVHTGASEFTLVLGAARARVTRGDAALGGGESAAGPSGSHGRLVASAAPGLPDGVQIEPPGAPSEPGAAAVAHAQPIVFPSGSARLGPDVRAALDALALRIGQQAAVEIEAHADASRKPGLAEARASALRDALASRGLPPANISLRSGGEVPGQGGASQGRVIGALVRWTTVPPLHPAEAADAASATPAFDVLPSDHDIAATLRRWARASGYELVWELDWVAPVSGQAHIDASSFVDAVRQVSAGLRAQGYPLRAQVFSDRVVRFSAPE